MKIGKEVIFLIAAIAFLIGFFYIQPAYTGFQVGGDPNDPPIVIPPEPEIEILLSQDTFIQSQPINGQTRINISGEIKSSDKVIATIGNVVSEKSLLDIIKDLKVPHTQIPTIYTGDNPESSKTLTFDSSGFKAVGIKLRKGSNVESLSLSIEGKQHNNEYLTYPKLDFGAKGTYNDWEYFGDLDSYATDAIIPTGLEESNTEETPQISPGVKYCEKVILPSSKSYKLTAKYKKITSVGIPRLEILNTDSTSIGECNLPTSVDSSSDWRDCIIDFDFPIEGEKFICFIVDGQGALVELSQDEEVTPVNPDSTGFTCDTSCQHNFPKDYYIKAFEGIYPKKLQTLENLPDWETSSSISRLSLNNYLANCQTYDFSEQFCMVPLKVISDSAGEIELKNLEINYRKDLSQYTENDLYDLSLPESIINIENPQFINIPLNIFLLFAPDPPSATLIIETTIGLETNESFNIIGKGLISNPISSTESKIEFTKTTLTNYQNDDIIITLGLKDDVTSAISQLLIYQNNISSIKNSNLDQTQKDSQALDINLAIDTLTTNFPRSISKKTIVKFKPSSIDYQTLRSEIPIQSGFESAIYELQSRINVDAEAQLVDIMYYSGNKETITFIKKTITSSQPLSNAEIIERIPKSVASSALDIKFRGQPTILRQDPIVKFIFPQISIQNPGIISYIVAGDVMSYIEESNLLYIPTGISNDLIGVDCGNNFCNYLEDYISCPEDCSCGNNICEASEDANTCFQDCGQKFPWSIVITITIIVLLSLYGIYFYMSVFRDPDRYKAYMDKLRGTPLIGLFMKKKKIFKSPRDKIKLKQFISNALAKGFKKEQVKSTLIKKGWTKEQIEEAFKK